MASPKRNDSPIAPAVILGTVVARGRLHPRALPQAAGRAPVAPAPLGDRLSASRYPAKRDPSNPLDLPVAPGSNPLDRRPLQRSRPLRRATMRPRRSPSCWGSTPKSLPPSSTWAQFAQQIESGPQQAKLNADPALAKQVDELAMIADQPQAQRISTFAWGGTPVRDRQADPQGCSARSPPATRARSRSSRPTSCIRISAGVPTTDQIDAYMPRFKAQIDAMVRATGRHPGGVHAGARCDRLLQSAWPGRARLPAWEVGAAVRDARGAVAAAHGRLRRGRLLGLQLGRGTPPRILKAIDVDSIRGFFTNDTHNQWTSNTRQLGNKYRQSDRRAFHRQHLG